MHRLNIGPIMYCSFCGFREENDQHIIWKCSENRIRWNLVSLMLVLINLDNIDVFFAGYWYCGTGLLGWKTTVSKTWLATCAWICGKPDAVWFSVISNLSRR